VPEELTERLPFYKKEIREASAMDMMYWLIGLNASIIKITF
jgi:hypothetical protein